MRTALVVTVLLLMGGCHVPQPVVPVVAESGSLTRILIAVDVDDDVDLCVQPTAWMLFEEPGLVGPVCGLSVGELRSWLRRQARAN